MTDLISRQTAIDALDSIGSLDTYADREYARGIFNALPSAQPEPSQMARDIATIIENEKDMRVIAQPETHEKRTETHSCDCISRWAVIGAVDKNRDTVFHNYVDYEGVLCDISNLPSAQPEIIRCKECKFYRCDGCFFSTAETEENGFCSWAERRTDG